VAIKTITGQFLIGQYLIGQGSPTPVAGVPSAQAFGVVKIPPRGVASAQAFGAVTIVPGPVSRQLAGVPSAQAFGAPGVWIIRLRPETCTDITLAADLESALTLVADLESDLVLQPAGCS
jgi:hypothetical protein